MKSRIISLIIFIIIVVIGCKKNTKNKVTENNLTVITKDYGDSSWEPIANDTTVTMEYVYLYVSAIEPPIAIDSSILNVNSDINILPPELFNHFYNGDMFNDKARIAKLPVVNGRKSIIIFYEDDMYELNIDYYTLSDDYFIIDRLPLFNTQQLKNVDASVKQTAYIFSDNKVRETKRRGNLTIEELVYYIDDQGYFQEQRDGKTPATIYESEDDITYMIEKLVWNDDNGRLSKTQTETIYYKFSDSTNYQREQR